MTNDILELDPWKAGESVIEANWVRIAEIDRELHILLREFHRKADPLEDERARLVKERDEINALLLRRMPPI